MAVIAANTGVIGAGSSGPVNLTAVTMTASDTLTYNSGSGAVLHLYNTTASAVTVTLVGSAPQPVAVPGYGSVATAGGKAITVPASGWTVVELDDISLYLVGNGTVTLTNGTGLKAALLTS